nr:MAG TPA: hypothetical protein [Caudoviricetes sp.]DAZ01930.1 MAG TPA: hypothetical protein [Caudoviricetes sp.]
MFFASQRHRIFKEHKVSAFLCLQLSFSLRLCKYGLTLSASLQNGILRSRLKIHVL